MNDFKELLDLPGPAQYQAYLKERLETLSVRENYVLSAALMRRPPQDAEAAVDCLNSLDGYDVCPASSYEELGQLSIQRLKVPEDVLPYVYLDQLGRRYEDEHPGLFIGECYVAYPGRPEPPVQQENGAASLWDDSWSVKLKLASSAVPAGVWLRLPDHDGTMAENSSEVTLVLAELKVDSLYDCVLLEARCILPEAGNLMEQYNSITGLVRDGDNLGFIMDEQGQGEPHWLEKFSAALEYEGCRTLKFALDIAQNLQCYEWISNDGLADFAANHLRSCGVPEKLIQSGAIDFNRYGADILETSGYMETGDERGYITRNSRQFIYEYTTPDGMGMTMQQ